MERLVGRLWFAGKGQTAGRDPETLASTPAPGDGAEVVLLGLLAVPASLSPLLPLGQGSRRGLNLQSAEGLGQGTCSARCGDIVTRLRELHRQREA